MKNISKKFDIVLSTEETSILKTGNKYYVGDDVEYTIQIISEHDYVTNLDIPMNLSECIIEAKGLRMTSKTTMTQEFGEREGGIISIIDEEKGLIKFKPKDTFVECADKLLVQFTITDSDESIAIQPFLSVVMDNIESENVLIPTNDIRTLKELDKLIESSKVSIEQIEFEMDRVSTEITNQLETMNETISADTDKLSVRLKDLEKQAEELKKNVDSIGRSTVRQLSATPIINSDNTVSFKVVVLGSKASNLIGTSIMTTISYLGLDEKQGTCFNGHIGATCYKNSSNISYTYLDITPIFSPTVPGVQIAPNLGFNGGVNKIESNTSYYEIWINTKIPKECIDSAKCHLTPFGNSLGE